MVKEVIKLNEGVSVSCSVVSDSDAVDCSPPGSFVRGILQIRILEWVALPSSSDQTHISCVFCLAGGFFNAEPLGKLKIYHTFII